MIYVFNKVRKNGDRSADFGFTVAVRLKGVLTVLKDEEGFDLVFISRSRARAFAEKFLEDVS